MRTTLTLDSDLLIAAKSIAAQSSRSIGEIISEWARRGLQASRVTERRGFPVFTVPGDAPPISDEAARRLQDDEGLPGRR